MGTRWSQYQTAKHELSLVRRDKLAAHCDLDACFDTPGFLGDVYRRQKERILSFIRDRNHKGLLPARQLATHLAYTQTRELIERLYPHTIEKEIERQEEQQWIYAATGLCLYFKDMSDMLRPQNLNLFYVGPFLDCLESAIQLETQIHKSLFLGDGQSTLEAIKRLRNIPDYSSHFPHHPPFSGGRRLPEKAASGAVSGGSMMPSGV